MPDEAATEFLQGFADRWLQAWNSHETEAVLDLLHEDILWEDLTFWPEPIEGRAGMVAYVEAIWRTMPDVHFTEIERFFSPSGERGLVLFRQEGGPPPGFEANAGFSTHGCDIFLAFADGRLSHYLASYDITEMMRQMSMLPPREGLLGGSYLRRLARAG